MNNYALVLLWRGRELPEYLVEKIAEVLTTNGICVPELLNAVYKDGDGIVNSLLKDIKIKDVHCTEEQSAIRQAVIYIGEKFKAHMKESVSSFAIAVATSYHTAMMRRSTEEDIALINAIKLLATTSEAIPLTLVEKYRLTTARLQVIKDVYNSVIIG